MPTLRQNHVSPFKENIQRRVADQLGLADLAVYAMFQCFRDADNALAILQRHPSVTAWMERVENASRLEDCPGGKEYHE